MLTGRREAARTIILMRTRYLLTAALTAPLLIVGAMVVPGDGAATPHAATLTAQLESATQVARESAGTGYWLVTADGTVTAFGSAHVYGSMTGTHLKAPITGIVATADGRGYWLVGADGGVFAFGDATFSGSFGGTYLAAPVVGMASHNGTQPSGLAGPRGPAGQRGLPGPRGTSGIAGTNGRNGAVGGTGPAGTNGGTGAAGGTGPQGPANVTNFAYVYNTGAETVAIEAAVPFDSNGPMAGFTHAPGNAGIEVTNSGTYRLTFSVSGVQPSEFAVFVNGAPLPSSIYGSGAGTQQDNGQMIVTLSANDVLTVVNHSSAAAVTLQTLAGGTQTDVNASVVIDQLG